jgi:chromosome segregation ATPase
MTEEKNKNNKNMTIDDLARLMQEEFSGINKRFDGVDKRFDEVDERFDGVETRLGGVETELAEVKSDVKWMKDNSGELFTKLDKFIKLYEDQKQELTSLSAQMERLEQRIEKLEQQNL